MIKFIFIFFIFVFAGTVCRGQENAKEEFDEGMQEFYKGKYEKAIRHFDEYIEILPNDYFGYKQRGLCYLNLKEYGDAVDDFDKSITIFPNKAEGYLFRSIARDYNDDFSEALKDIQKASSLEPKNPDVFVYKSLLYLNNKKYSDAGKTIEDAGKNFSENARPDIMKAFVNIFLNKFDDIPENLKLAINKDSLELIVNFKKDLTYLKPQISGLAISLCDKQIKNNPGSSLLYLCRSIAYLAKGDKIKSQKDLEKAKEFNNTSGKVLSYVIFRMELLIRN